MKYTYSLDKIEQPINATYTEEELRQLTTLQLREICLKEKIVVGVAYKLDRQYMINTILKYRGAKLRCFINSYIEESFEALTENFSKLLSIVATKDIFIPVRITLFKNMDLDTFDKYIVKSGGLSLDRGSDADSLDSNALDLKEGNVLLLDGNNNISGILNLVLEDGMLYLCCNHKLINVDLETSVFKNYSLGFLTEKGSKYLYDYYHGQEKRHLKTACYTVPISELHIVIAQKAKTPLVIDFGTSNSSAGAYLDEHQVPTQIKWDLQKNGISFNDINKVKFVDTSEKSKFEQLKEVIPTIIGVKSCSDPYNVIYRYGYDALQYSKRYGYNSPASVFFGIKRWVNNYNKKEDISDEEGNIAQVSRLDILKAYFEYIITLACKHHKCFYKTLHITSPVKQKQQFLEMYRAALPGCEIVSETALDEGIAVLYNSISNQIEKRRFEEKQEYKALIIDCGGGTTDLTSSTYYIKDNQITYELDLTTTYANGETNFGGNNITYRIFQYLKIAFARYYTGKLEQRPKEQYKISVEDVFNEDLEDIYRHVDENGHESVYSKLENMYYACEDIIPTKYYDYRNAGTEDYMKVRSNFYFLWNLSEKIKIDFFHTYSVAYTSFHIHGIKEDAKSLKITAEESWRLNIYQDTKRYALKKNITNFSREMILHTDLPDIIVTKEEVSVLIKADIYNLIKKFIEPIYYSEGLDQFDFIKLTGQTCKIDIFRDALKEFIPGKLIESSKKEKTVNDFKLTCLEGAVKYQNARVIGLIAPKITNNAPITPYKLTAHTHTGTEITMISSLKELHKSYGYISKNIDTETMELILKSADDKVLHKYHLDTNKTHFRPTDYVETTEVLSQKIPQDDIDSIIDNEIKVFTYALEDKWGFFVLPLARVQGTLLMGENKYFSFENDEWELNFFDGQK